MSRLCENRISAKSVNAGNRGCESLVVKNPAQWCNDNNKPPNQCAIWSYVLLPDGRPDYLTTHLKDVDNCDLYFDPFTMEKCGGGTEGVRGVAQGAGNRYRTKGELPGTCFELNEPSSQCDVPADLINDPYIKQAINRDVALEFLENKWKLNCGGKLPGSCSSRITQEACENTFSTDTNTGYEHCIWHNESCVPSSTTKNPNMVAYEDPTTCRAIGNAEFNPLYLSQDPDARFLDPLNTIHFDFTQPNQAPGEMGFNNGDFCNLGHLQQILDNNCPQFSFLPNMNPDNVQDSLGSLGDAQATACTPECYHNFILDWFNNCYSDDEKKNAIKDEMIRKISKQYNNNVGYDSALDVAVLQKQFLETIQNRYCTDNPNFQPGTSQYRNPNATDRVNQTYCNFHNMSTAFSEYCPEFVNQDATIRVPSSSTDCSSNCYNFRRGWWSQCAGIDGSDGGNIQDDTIWGGILNEMQQMPIYTNRNPQTDLENIRIVSSTCEVGH